MAPLLSPDLNRRLIDRYLVAAEVGKIKPIIAVNKIDLVQGMNAQDILQPYHDLGITILYMSALYGEGIKPLEEHLKDKTSVFSGQSGAGKSTLVNSLLGEQVQVVSEISDKSNKGRHTTSFVAEFDLPFGGTVIDTPGIREFALAGVDKQNLPLYFHEFDDFMLNCKYKPCSHTHEPNCAVAEAVENGEIDYERYESYIYLYESLSD
jgi:ribosome biogenesis GTPase